MTKTAIFIPCSVNLLLPGTAFSVETVLNRLGVFPVYPDSQTCCGQMVYNKGFFDEARTFARHFIHVFEGYDAIVCPSGSCTAMVKYRYPTLFDGEPVMKRKAEEISGKIFEFSQFIVDVLMIRDTWGVFEGSAAYHESCHVKRDLGVSEQPKALIGSTRGTRLVHMNNSDQCCGFGGEFSVAYPEISEALVSNKVKNFIDCGADVLVLNEPGCYLNIKGYLERHHPDRQVMHIADFLAGKG
jgi:L-lactate dehydrogenase complex protein LldE